MSNETSKKSMTDMEMMNLAKERVALRNSFKMHCVAFFIVSALIAMNSIFNNWGIGVALFILGWGLLVAFHGVLVCFRFLDVSASVTGEYERIKRTVMNEDNFSNEGQKQNDVSKLPIIEGMAHESEAKQEYKQMSKTMTEERKIKLIGQYRIYTKIDWVIFVLVLGMIFGPLLLFMLSSLAYTVGLGAAQEMSIFLRHGEGAMGNFMGMLYSIPLIILIPLFIIFTIYNIWSIWLYVKVWPIKEIPKGFVYWFDWFLLVVLTAYDVFLFYVILTR